MKKIAGKIAMILIVVLLANSLTSCTLGMGVLGKAIDKDGLIWVGVALDVGGLIFGIWRFVSRISSRNSSEYAQALPDGIEQSSFMKAFNALPETQIDTLTKKVQAVPETEMTSFLETFNAIPQADIIFRLNTVSETEVYNTAGYLNSLSEEQFNALLRNIVDNIAYVPTQ